MKDYRFRTNLDSSYYSSLTSLELRFVDIHRQQLQYILGKCPNLKELNLESARNLEKLNVDGQSLKLEMLKIANRYKLAELNICGPPQLKNLKLLFCPHLEKVDISAKNLLTLSYNGHFDRLFLEDVPALSELDTSGTVWLTLCKKSCKLFEHIKQLERLRLRLPPHDCIRKPNFRVKFPILGRLKQLELEINHASENTLLLLVRLIKVCPSLNTLSMQYIHQERRFEYLAGKIATTIGAAKFQHRCLKVLEVSDFVGYKAECEFVLSFVAIAGSLEKVVIHPSDQFQDKSRDRAKQLTSKLPPTVNLVLM